MSDNDGYTAVHLAAKDGHDGVLEKLLSTGESFIWVIYIFTSKFARSFLFMTSLESGTFSWFILH